MGALRLAHALAAALWVGSALVFALNAAGASGGRPSPLFRETLGAGVAVFVLTGTILAVQRLSSAPVPPSYAVLLAVKVALGVWMFVIARSLGTRSESRPPRIPVYWQLAGIGVVIYALAIALQAIYEGSIRL